MKIIFSILLLSVSGAVLAHGGGLNSSGCHNQKGGSYHCHRSASSTPESYSGSFSLGDQSRPAKRSSSAKNNFRKAHPCPSTGKTTGSCPGYHVDHQIPLACGGADAAYNMQWLTAEQNLRKGSMGCRD